MRRDAARKLWRKLQEQGVAPGPAAVGRGRGHLTWERLKAPSNSGVDDTQNRATEEAATHHRA